MRQRAATASGHAEAVCVVDKQPRVVHFRQLQQLRQRRDVTVHAEHSVGADQLALRTALRQAAGELVEIPMAVADELSARQPRRVVEAGVVQAIAEHRVAATAKHGDNGEIGQVSRRE